MLRRLALVAVLLTTGCTPTTPVSAPSVVPNASPGSPPAPASGASPATSACRALDIKPGTDAAFVAVAERAPIAVAFVLDAATGAIRGRVEVPSAVPELALDTRGNQLIVLCEGQQVSQLVAYDLDTLTERWRVGTADPHTTKATGGLPTLGVSRDGSILYLQHSKALKADAEAPGGSRYWLSIHDAHTGATMTEVELPECKAGSRLVAGAPASVTVVCKDGARVAEAPTWRVVRTIPVASLGPLALIDDTRLLGISTQLQVLGVDLGTGNTFEDSKWDESGASRVTDWGRLTATADGTRLWVLTGPAVSGSAVQVPPDTLTEINLTTRKRIDTPVPGLRGVGLIGRRVVYFVQGRLRSTDGALDVLLLNGSVEHWGVVARS